MVIQTACRSAHADSFPELSLGEQKNAAEWLRELLDETDGMQAGEIIRLGKKNGLAERTIYHAKAKLGVVVKMSGFGRTRSVSGGSPFQLFRQSRHQSCHCCQPQAMANMATLI
jgi:hypothetical protein